MTSTITERRPATECRERPKVVPLSIGVLCLCVWLLPRQADADWDVTPSITASAVFTDNLFLATEGLEESGRIVLVSPAISLSNETGRFTGDVDYSLESLVYNGVPNADETYHQLDAVTQWAMGRNFFLDLTAARSQQITDSSREFVFTNFPITDNRGDVSTVSIRPRWQQTLGSQVEASVSVEKGFLEYNGTDIQTLESNIRETWIGSTERDTGGTWRVQYEDREYEYELSPEERFRSATLELGYWVTPSLRLFGTAGKESDYLDPTADSLSENAREAGIQIARGERFELTMAAGERSFGDTERFEVRYDLRRGAMTLTHVEEPLANGEFQFGLHSRDIPIDFGTILTRPGEAGRFISNRTEWSFNYDFSRITLMASLVKEDQIILPSDDQVEDELRNAEDMEGVFIDVLWEAGARTSFAWNVSSIRRWIEDEGREDEIGRVQFTTSYRLGSRTSLSLTLSRVDNDSTFVADDYVENIGILSFTREF